MLLSAEEWASAPPDVADREWRLVSHAIVDDEAGETLELGRATAGAAVRRFQEGRPETDWNRWYTFDRADAPLTRGDLIAAGGGR
ncbi:hypothetical protein ACWGF2_25895 [Streptomyces sp. NPDC054919]